MRLSAQTKRCRKARYDLNSTTRRQRNDNALYAAKQPPQSWRSTRSRASPPPTTRLNKPRITRPAHDAASLPTMPPLPAGVPPTAMLASPPSTPHCAPNYLAPKARQRSQNSCPRGEIAQARTMAEATLRGHEFVGRRAWIARGRETGAGLWRAWGEQRQVCAGRRWVRAERK